ncbi:MAG: ABC transporter permease, partial [bacterium]
MFRTIAALVRKEFYQIRRDRLTLRLIFVVPILQLFLLAYAISTDVKFIYTSVYDYDRTKLSRELVRSMSAGDYFIPTGAELPLLASEQDLLSGKRNVNLIIPPKFSRRLLTSQPSTVGFVVDGANANSASIASGYANLIAQRFSQQLTRTPPSLTLGGRVLYNPEGESVYFIVPGIV